MLGAFVLGRAGERLSRPGLIALGLLGFGLSLGLLALVSSGAWSLWLVPVIVLGAGLALALVVIPARTVLQERPPPHLRGRVIASQLMGRGITNLNVTPDWTADT